MAYSFKGNLSFGFVFIPVTLQLAAKDNKVSFRLFDKKTKSKILYKKVCEDCNGKEVKNEDIVKGYEYQDGKYVLLDDDDFEKIKTSKDKNITVDCFVNLDEVDPIYYDKSYYVTPIGAEKAYFLLVKALKETKKVGLGKTILGTKESLVLIRAKDNYLVLSTLYFEDEIKKYSLELENIKISASELKLAKLLINEMAKEFDISSYNDTYIEKINKLIQIKIKGNKIVAPKKQKEVQITDLMDALKTSLETMSKKKRTRKSSSNSNYS